MVGAAGQPRGKATAEARSRLAAGDRMPQILEAALDEFAERGYDGARMAAVAARASIAKGLIYHYFPSKSELFQATVRACTRRVFEEAERHVADLGSSAREMLAALVGLAYGQVCGDRRERALFRLIVIEAERVPDLARFYQEEVLARGVAIAEAVLRAGVASGEFRPEVAAVPGLAEVMLAPAIMASVWQMILGAAAPAPARLRTAHLDLLLAGLAARGT